MTYTAYIPFALPDLNSYNKTSRSPQVGAIMANRIKQDTEGIICACLPYRKGWDPQYPLRISFIWHVVSRKKDLDNIAFGQKFVLDALQKKGIIKGDGMKYIAEINHRYQLGSENGVTIELQEIQDEAPEK